MHRLFVRAAEDPDGNPWAPTLDAEDKVNALRRRGGRTT
jgi:hypothetical protein